MSTTTTSPTLEPPVRHLVVGAGPIRAAPDDDEVDGVVTSLEDGFGDVLSYFALGSSWTQQVRNLFVDSVDGPAPPAGAVRSLGRS